MIKNQYKFIIAAIFFILSIGNTIFAQKQTSDFVIGRVKYSGGGDWYNDQSADYNLLKYIAQNTNISTNPGYQYVDLASDKIFEYPFLFITGHGNMKFSDVEVRNLRAYLQNGGFLYIDDDYGLDQSIRSEMKKVFPDQDFRELPFSYGLYSIHYKFPQGPPKTHEHDNKPPKGFGLFYNGRLCVYYTYESNPSDGWADPEVHNDPPAKREEALRFGTNIVVWALTH
ncbi:MAG TPA: DUF4159 domain-containing protein [Bacteroidota bacterium]|nr:DUF4159 domain-containing protein [Candidatus Kapabacteria bacterium]HRS01138.1 DUF4159 domain-containing protein [Bacteroidota bacterium]HRT67976.1 DUF4159 domain-containing protein [Bacteroidota bacterium]